jgi:hypothetical protein
MPGGIEMIDQKVKDELREKVRIAKEKQIGVSDRLKTTSLAEGVLNVIERLEKTYLENERNGGLL